MLKSISVNEYRLEDAYATLRRGDGFTALLTARTSGKRCTSAIKFASKVEVLSLRHAKNSGRATSKSTTGKMTTLSGNRKRELPTTHPTPKLLDTRFRIAASFSPS